MREKTGADARVRLHSQRYLVNFLVKLDLDFAFGDAEVNREGVARLLPNLRRLRCTAEGDVKCELPMGHEDVCPGEDERRQVLDSSLGDGGAKDEGQLTDVWVQGVLQHMAPRLVSLIDAELGRSVLLDTGVGVITRVGVQVLTGG